MRIFKRVFLKGASLKKCFVIGIWNTLNVSARADETGHFMPRQISISTTSINIVRWREGATSIRRLQVRESSVIRYSVQTRFIPHISNIVKCVIHILGVRVYSPQVHNAVRIYMYCYGVCTRCM